MNVRNMNQQEKVDYMLKEPVPHLVCQMAVPTIISMLVTSFYNMADTFFVGKINTQATAAVGVVFSSGMVPVTSFPESLVQENLRRQTKWRLPAFSLPFLREFCWES